VEVISRADFDALFVEEYPKLVALGVSMTGDREVARELAQETMIRAHARWADLEQYDEPRAWLRRVMSNLLIDHHRLATSERSALERLGSGSASSEDSPGIPSRWAELVSPLTVRQRLVATLYYAEDLSVAEIARILDLSPGSVKSTLSKARHRLRRHHPGGFA
jgi:RNA polymerase sigma-70 factor, ECF subfamily